MSVLIKCDVCKAIVDDDKYFEVEIIVNDIETEEIRKTGYADHVYDVCPVCVQKLDEFTNQFFSIRKDTDNG